jgi:hypothetical protein
MSKVMRKSRDYKTEYKRTLCSLAVLGISVVAYLYFLNISVIHVVMRQEALQDVKTLQTEIAVLESAYIEAQHVIAARIATLDDFNSDAEKIFVTRDSASLVLGSQ